MAMDTIKEAQTQTKVAQLNSDLTSSCFVTLLCAAALPAVCA